MFEYDQKIVDALLSEDISFKRLYEKHSDLKRKVHEANMGALAMDDFSLENMKKEKLFLKDQMAEIIERYRRTHA